MKIVVTGGAGFIGSNVVRALAAVPEVDEIVILDDLSTGSLDNIRELPARLLTGTILDGALLDEAFAGAASVVHLAAIPSVPRSIHDPYRSHQANATGTLLVLEAVRRHGVPQVVLASSSSVYGGNLALPKRETLRAMPLSPYAVSKLATEAYAIAYASCFGLSVLPFRFFNVFGPGQAANHAYAAVVPAFVSAALDGRPLRVFGDGRQTRDFTFVGSVASVIVDAVRRRVSAPDAVNLAFGTRTSLGVLVGELEAVLGRRLEVTYEAARPGDARDSQADCTVLRSLFPGVRPYPLRAGLEVTVAWMSDHVPAAR
ncbi:NAD-dependent epimerase/dehydratase family protein [Plantactinospora mayteni]|uniref:NAD-dependent dehydratase n=1 Tax=Plantactinospora mayteni TaxID=566021 RepID=A0ABQ4EGM5_9ACTN|nr:NAD-dependent epimerase/dehydratase family protein [Plantactinospora mayteni]GIG93882.1 NAD-dependent dehydratase [Plantactinospora mayteni]